MNIVTVKKANYKTYKEKKLAFLPFMSQLLLYCTVHSGIV